MSTSSSRPKVNLRSTAVKRIMQEASELAESNDEDFTAGPLESDIFEWHCTMRGVPDSEYEGGLYHLRIILPPSYPMSAPDIMLLTPNGRFELGKKICIDGLTSFHAGSWQPAWGVRTAILGLRSFWMQGGEALSAIGALDYTKEERRRLAKLSREWICNTCNCRNIDNLPDVPHVQDEHRQSDVSEVDQKGEDTESADKIGRSSGVSGPSRYDELLVEPTADDRNGTMAEVMPDPIPVDTSISSASASSSLPELLPDSSHIPRISQPPTPSHSSVSPLDTASNADPSPIPISTSETTIPSIPPPRSSPTPTTQPQPSRASIHRRVPLWIDAAIFACFSILFLLLVRKALLGGGRDEGVMRELEL